MNKTQIEWVKNPDGTQGYTWNPVTGCLNGCEYCYARKLANGRCRRLYLANDNLSIKKTGQLYYDECWAAREQDPFFPRFWPERLDERRPPVAREQSYVRYSFPCSETFAYRKFNYKPKGIFVCDMGDLFGIGIPEEWTRKVLGVIKCNPADRFYLLTKQPQNLPQWSPFPDNCWVGVTATDDDMFCDAIFWLNNIEARVKYISFEPLLAEVSLNALDFYGINWVIIGSQTKPSVMPRIEWVEEIVRACDKAGVKVFLKDNLEPLYCDLGLKKLKECVGYEQYAHADDLVMGVKLRQELPK